MTELPVKFQSHYLKAKSAIDPDQIKWEALKKPMDNKGSGCPLSFCKLLFIVLIIAVNLILQYSEKYIEKQS